MSPVHEVRNGGAIVRIAPALGGRVTALRLVGASGPRDLLFPFPEESRVEDLLRWPKGGIYPLVPYGNRIRDARLMFEGREHRLRPHPGAAPHTLHGPAHRRPWVLTDAGEHRAEWALVYPSDDEWPWRFRARLSVDLQPSAASFHIAVENEDDGPMPAGLGLHPYFIHDAGDRLDLAATHDWPATPDFLADAPRPIAGGGTAAALPPGAVDRYRSGWGGRCSVHANAGFSLLLKADPVFDHLVVHRPDDGLYLCLEPTTHAPDGFNLAARGLAAAGLHVLKPGASLSGRITVSLSR